MIKIIENPIVKFIIKFVKTVLTTFIVILALMIAIQRLSNNRLTLGGYQIFTIVSGSMEPKYDVGDMLIAKSAKPENLKIGDDIVYKGEKSELKDKIITHQIIDITKDELGNYNYTLKGIANDTSDPIVHQDQIFGKIVYKSIILSWMSKLISNNYGFYFFIFVPLAVLIFVDVVDEVNFQKRRKERKKKNKELLNQEENKTEEEQEEIKTEEISGETNEKINDENKIQEEIIEISEESKTDTKEENINNFDSNEESKITSEIKED